MSKPYSIDLREKIVIAYNNDEDSMRDLAERFKVSFSFVSKLLQKFHLHGEIGPKPHGGGQPASISASGEVFLKKLIESQPDLTLVEIRDEYNQHFKTVSRSTIDRTLTKLKITRKKKTLFDSRKNTPENQEARRVYENNLESLEAKALIFLDETGSVRNLTRGHARSPLGHRAHRENSLTRGTRISTLGALGIGGLLAAFCYEGTLTGFLFAFFVKEFLVPVLTSSNVVIMDNARVHDDEDAIAMIEATGARTMFLPAYSPELNPIELMWSKVKNFIKKTVISNTEELYQALADALETITPDDAQNCFQHCL